MTRRLHIVVDVSDVPGADVETAEELAYSLLSADDEYSAPPHTAYWEDDKVMVDAKSWRLRSDFGVVPTDD